ncbi:MAG: aldehyde dehydrogenase (NADP(+)) [Acidobacteriota bacterium]
MNNEVDRAANAADAALDAYSALAPERIAAFLEKTADEIVAIGDELLQCASAETALGRDRLTGERGRTVNQLRLFADVARQGTWKDIRIDPALPERKPLRRPDLRRTMLPIGPVAVWAASNFPLAFSVAGGDTASALAAGCPVVLKAHPGHPKTSRLVADAIARAMAALEIPAGVFSMIEGASPEVSLALVRHPKIAAGAFTGSLRAGRALFDAANQRAAPIPFFAEMGSVNPVFVLPGALAERGGAIAEGLAGSVNMGFGQFCTSPGVVVVQTDDAFATQLRERFAKAAPGTMLTEAIATAYVNAVKHLESTGLKTTQASGAGPQPALFETSAAKFLEQEELRHEVFGPATILVSCGSAVEAEAVASALEGSLTATVHGTEEDLRGHAGLLRILARKAGRLIFNGYPTGVEVAAAMQHGGPYPATTDARFTSVGTAAIQRFGRPICYQDFPAEFLPAELR